MRQVATTTAPAPMIASRPMVEPSVTTIDAPLFRRLTMSDVGEALALVELTRPGPFAERTLVAAGQCTPVDRAAPPEVVTAEGEIVHAGQVMGAIEVTGGSVEVTSAHTPGS